MRGGVTFNQQRAAALRQSLEAALREQEEKSREKATLKMEALQAAKDLQLGPLTEGHRLTGVASQGGAGDLPSEGGVAGSTIPRLHDQPCCHGDVIE